MNRLMSTALAVSFALAGCANLPADRSSQPPGSPDWRDLSAPAAPQDPNAGAGATSSRDSHSDEYAEPLERDEGKF
jgi:hypothetical protein